MAKIGRAKRANRIIGQTIEPLESRVLLSTIVVNTTIDGVFPPSTGIVSLRSAIATANSSSSPTTISFDPTVFATPQTISVQGTGFVLDGSQQTMISGPASGVTLDGRAVGTILQISGGNAQLTGLTISWGSGNGILNNATLTLTDVTLVGNAGGGLSNSGVASLSNVTVRNNAQYGISNALHASLSISGAVISSNTGSGIYSLDGSNVNIANATISGNHSSYDGGGVYIVGGPTSLTDVAVSDNSAAKDGGGIDNAAGAMSLTNVTISGNSASGYGGGINNGGESVTGNGNSLSLTNCTVAGNSANSAGGIINDVGCTSTVSNTIVAGNSLTGGGGSGPDANGSFNSLGYNLIGETDGSTGWNIYDLTGTASASLNPKLSALGNYGGPTQTMALLPGSPALNAGWSALAVDASDNPLTTDQRGLPRIYGSSVDIGAYESQPPALAGDVNHDGTVNLADLLLLTRDFGKATPMYEGGDLDGDGSVGLTDFLILTRNFGTSAQTSATVLSSSASRSSLVPGSGESNLRTPLRRRRLAAALAV